MISATAKGRNAERAAEDYLVARGWQVLSRNHRTPAGELDLVCRDGAETVIVEVKGRSSSTYGEGVEAIGPRKATRLRAAAAWWMAEQGCSPRGLRFDVVSVDLSAQGSLLHLWHLRNVLA